MAMTVWSVNAFLELYPEFKYAGAMVQRALSAAALRINPDHYGTSTHEAIGLMAAITLASSPFSQTQKQDGAGNAQLTEYKERLNAIKLEKRIGIIVL